MYIILLYNPVHIGKRVMIFQIEIVTMTMITCGSKCVFIKITSIL